MATPINVITHPYQCQSIRLPECDNPAKIIAKLMYIQSGKTIVALNSDGVHLIWDVVEDQPSWPDTVNIVFRPWKLCIRKMMRNAVVNLTSVVPCLSLSKDGHMLASVSGGNIALFGTETLAALAMVRFKDMHPAAPTSIVFHPQDCDIVIVGMEDTLIIVYNARTGELLATLNGHLKRVTGLAITDSADLLVSVGADFKICLWSSNGWRIQSSVFLSLPIAIKTSDTVVEFHRNQTRLLVVHEMQLAQYEIGQLALLNRWLAQGSHEFISHATYSCDSELVFAGHVDGAIRIFHAAELEPRCRIDANAYLPLRRLSILYSLVMAAHPKRPNQFAVGVADDGVYVFEPHESQGQWHRTLGKGPGSR